MLPPFLKIRNVRHPFPLRGVVNLYGAHFCLTSWRQALLGRKFQLHASLAAYAWVGRLRGDRDCIRIKTFTRPDECILNAKMIWIEMWRARACGQEVAAFDGWNNFREANLNQVIVTCVINLMHPHMEMWSPGGITSSARGLTCTNINITAGIDLGRTHALCFVYCGQCINIDWWK